VLKWFQKDPLTPSDIIPIADLRLLTVRNPTHYPSVKFPMEGQTLKSLLRGNFPPWTNSRMPSMLVDLQYLRWNLRTARRSV